jgi:3-oxoacyl-[acyl-carrier-protein] synthase II
MRRVVVTGMGLVTPLGLGVEHVWRKLLAGDSGITAIRTFDVSDLPAKIAGSVPRGAAQPGLLDPNDYVPGKEQRRMSDFILYAIAAAQEAIATAGWTPSDPHERERTGVMIGSGVGGLPSIEENAVKLHEKGPRRISPFFIPGCLVNEAAGVVSIRYGFQGPNHAVATACATGAHAIGDAARMIQLDDADVMIAGGTEAALSRLAISGFAIMRALSTGFNDAPARASRPWDRDRDGFVLGEGAGVVVLEELEHAKRRGAAILGELLGYGLSGDAHHMTSPAPNGHGALRAMRAAIQRAQLAPGDIDYVNAHATSTEVGDPVEIHAVKELFGEAARGLSMSSTKSATGHLLGAAGAVEAIFSLLALRDQIAPPTLNLEHPSEDWQLDLVPHAARQRPIRYALSNSFGFGGTNAALVFAGARGASRSRA